MSHEKFRVYFPSPPSLAQYKLFSAQFNKKNYFRQPSISLGIKKGKTMLFPWITLRLRDVWGKERRPLIHPFFRPSKPVFFFVEKGHGNTVPLENKRKAFSA